jgi:hypothetical protein
MEFLHVYGNLINLEYSRWTTQKGVHKYNQSQSFTRIRGSEGHLLYHWWEQEGSAEFSIIGEAYEEGLWWEAEADKNDKSVKDLVLLLYEICFIS